MGCRLYLGDRPQVIGYTMQDHRGGPPTKATHGGRDGLQLPMWQPRIIAAARKNHSSLMSDRPTMVSPFWPCWVMRAQCSGCKWGFPIGNRSPLQVPLRSTTWTSNGGVYSRSPPSPRSPTYMGLRTPATRPLSSPCSPRSPPARPHALTELRRPSDLFPGIPLTHGPPHGCLRTPHPPPQVAA